VWTRKWRRTANLEDKFHGLELHHVPRDYNKATSILAKTASSRSPVPHGVFTSDQHAPSVRAEGRSPPRRRNLKPWRSNSYTS
jgi:hypothetical protein